MKNNKKIETIYSLLYISLFIILTIYTKANKSVETFLLSVITMIIAKINHKNNTLINIFFWIAIIIYIIAIITLANKMITTPSNCS